MPFSGTTFSIRQCSMWDELIKLILKTNFARDLRDSKDISEYYETFA